MNCRRCFLVFCPIEALRTPPTTRECYQLAVSDAAMRFMTLLYPFPFPLSFGDQVVGCTAHSMNFRTRKELQNPGVFSMANVRDITDRIVSGFFYSSPHSPPCARNEDVVRNALCFLSTILLYSVQMHSMCECICARTWGSCRDLRLLLSMGRYCLAARVRMLHRTQQKIEDRKHERMINECLPR